jgi:hypothetical protein
MCTVVEDALYHHFRCFVPSRPLEWRRHKCLQNEERNSFPQQVPLKQDPIFERGWLKKGTTIHILRPRYAVTRPNDKFPYPGRGEANQILEGAKIFASSGLGRSFHRHQNFPAVYRKTMCPGTRRFRHVGNVKCLTAGT